MNGDIRAPTAEAITAGEQGEREWWKGSAVLTLVDRVGRLLEMLVNGLVDDDHGEQTRIKGKQKSTEDLNGRVTEGGGEAA